MNVSQKSRHSKISSVIILPMMGVVTLIGSIPFFLIDKPIVVFHQGYRVFSRGVAEVIDHESGMLYGVVLAAIGLFLIYLYVRIRQDRHEDRPHLGE